MNRREKKAKSRYGTGSQTPGRLLKWNTKRSFGTGMQCIMFETKGKEKPWNKFPDAMRVFAWKSRRRPGQAAKY